MRSLLLSGLACVLFTMPAFGVPVIFSAGGDANPASIQPTVNVFRAAVGSPNNGNAIGPLMGGRREINWDGGGTATTPAGNPFAGFQLIRGALFTTAGTGFVQAPPTGGAGGGLATFFGNPTYGTIFSTFSSPRLVTPVGSNITDVTFFLPGTTTPALVRDFGAVFTDVDLPNATSLEFFDPDGLLLHASFVPNGTVADGSLSFLGVSFNSGEEIARVRITSGNAALGPNDGGGIDVVALDDFMFSEPFAGAGVPEPLTAATGLIGLVGVGLVIFRRRVGGPPTDPPVERRKAI